MTPFSSLCQRIQRNDPTLSILNCNGWNLGSQICILVEALGPQNQLIVVFLNQNELYNIGKLIPRLTTKTQYLYLSKNPFGNQGAACLGKQLPCSQWKSLSVSGCQISNCNDLAAALPGNETLKTLDLSYNKLHPASLQYLLDNLRYNTCLETLDLRGCCDDETALSVALVQLLQTNETLVEITLNQMSLPLERLLSSNKFGRRHWRQTSLHHGLFARVLSKDDPSILFQVFQQRPDLLPGK